MYNTTQALPPLVLCSAPRAGGAPSLWVDSYFAPVLPPSPSTSLASAFLAQWPLAAVALRSAQPWPCPLGGSGSTPPRRRRVLDLPRELQAPPLDVDAKCQLAASSIPNLKDRRSDADPPVPVHESLVRGPDHTRVRKQELQKIS